MDKLNLLSILVQTTPKFLNSVLRVGTFLRAETSWHFLTSRGELALSYEPRRVGTFLRAETSWNLLTRRDELALSYGQNRVGMFFLSGDDIMYFRKFYHNFTVRVCACVRACVRAV